MLLGIHLTLMIGPSIAVPAPATLTEALTAVEVTHGDQGRSGFQLTFQVGRSGPLDLIDYPFLLNPALLKPFNRVVLVTTFNVTPRVLMDGVITNVQLAPSEEPGSSTLTVTGEDVSLMLDLKQKQFPWPSLPEDSVVRAILAQYPQYAILPTEVMPPLVPNVQPPTREVPVQVDTDLKYITCLAERHGFVFYVKPGPAPNQSTAYWGPPNAGLPQKSLKVNLASESNVNSINFSYNALAPLVIVGTIQDAETNVAVPVRTPPVSTRVPLAGQPAIVFNQPNVRERLPPVTPEVAEWLNEAGGGAARGMGCGQASTMQGLSAVQAQSRAQALVSASTDQVVTATGELSAEQYGDILETRRAVCVRGAGYNYDGLYRVKSVTHNIRRGEYKQRFILTREGTGALSPLCP
jgi:hypothetical protein